MAKSKTKFVGRTDIKIDEEIDDAYSSIQVYRFMIP